MTGTPPSTRHLVIFAKTPRLGRVKSRLADDLGLVPAWQFYRQNLATITRRLGHDPRWQTWIAITPDGAPTGVARDLPAFDQGIGDLGDRMHRAMINLPHGPVVIVGTDIPDIQRRDVARAFETLGNRDAVLGPATDGGYWLIGLKRRPRLPRAFNGVRWSGPHAFDDTLANLKSQSCSIGLLHALEDIDDLASLERWKHRRT